MKSAYSKYSLLFVFMFLLSGCNVKNISLPNVVSNEKKELKREEISPELKSKINEIVNTILNNDINTINEKYINKDFGFYNVHKSDEGVKLVNLQKAIYTVENSLFDEITDLVKYASQDSKNHIFYEEDVKFNCSPNNDALYGWNKEGLFLSDNLDINLPELLKSYSSYKEEDFKKAELINKTSYKVVLTPYLSFYLTKIDNKWYITLFDRATSSCS